MASVESDLGSWVEAQVHSETGLVLDYCRKVSFQMQCLSATIESPFEPGDAAFAKLCTLEHLPTYTTFLDPEYNGYSNNPSGYSNQESAALDERAHPGYRHALDSVVEQWNQLPVHEREMPIALWYSAIALREIVEGKVSPMPDMLVEAAKR